MSKPKVIAAHSPPLRIAEWTTRYKGTFPRHTTSDGPEPIHLAEGYASFVLDRWVYVIVQRATDKDEGEVAHELYVDKTGRIWVTEGDHHLEIPARGRSVEGHASHTVQLPVLDRQSNALWVWLFLAPFRFPKLAVRDLGLLAGEIARHAPPLWEWNKGRGLPGVVHSRDDWSLQETPLWLTVPPGLPDAGTKQRIAVGIDPFTIAKLRSNKYVKAYAKYKKAYEPENPEPGSEFQRIALARLIEQTIFSNDAAADKYREHVNLSAMNAAIKADDERRNKLIRASEEAAFDLVEVMRSKLFELTVQASISDEGIDDSEPSPALKVLYEVLGRCTRSLNGSTAGRALLQHWAQTAAKAPDFFINHVILPKKDPSVARFKAFRWGSKAIASVLIQYVAHEVASLRGKIIAPVAKEFEEELIEALGRLAGQATPVDFTIEATLNAKRVVKRVHLKYNVGAYKVAKIDMPFLGPAKEGAWIEAWIDAGELKEFGVAAKFGNAKFLGSLILDVVNLALAVKVARDADPGTETLFAVTAAGAHSFNLIAAIGDEYMKTVVKDSALRRSQSYFLRVRGVAAAVFAGKNYIDARAALLKGDEDRAVSLGVAVVGEAAASIGYFISALAPASVAGPWIAVLGTLVAAGAYIAAETFADDELATFLSHGEWGSRPYSEPELQLQWAARPVGEWRDDYVKQRRLMFKLMTKFSVGWASHGICAMGVKVTLAVVTPDSVLRVQFVARRDGNEQTETLVFRHGSLPTEFPGSVSARPEDTLRSGEPPDLRAVVTYQWHPDEPADSVTFTLRAAGVDQPDGDISSLAIPTPGV